MLAESCDAGTEVGVRRKNLTGFFPDFSTAQYHVTGTQPCPQKKPRPLLKTYPIQIKVLSEQC